jgi:hypothetical protein
VVGSIRMDEATAKLLSVYGDTDIERLSATGSAPLAILTLDSKGFPVEPSPLAVSSFAWGFPIALRRDLHALGDWPIAEPKILQEAEKVAFARVEEGERQPPISQSIIDCLFQHLVDRLQLPRDCIEPPSFSFRVYQWYRADDPPEPPPMGSFFLSDLATAKGFVEDHKAPDILRRYLALTSPKQRIDLLCDDASLADAVAPSALSSGCWPTKGKFPLVLLQQAAVNLAMSEGETTQLLPVNGPPGTGKTTLLRDLVTAVLVKRAKAMSAFSDPNDAFAASGNRFRSGNTFITHYAIDPKLAGFEIVVASSNNRAVENVSAELPTLDAIEKADVRYFKSVADNVSRVELDNDGESENERRPEETWGLVAAVLGNAKNRSIFRKAAWADNDFGLRRYLLEASGNPQTIDQIDEATGRIVERRKPKVVLEEEPPTNDEAALKRWRAARKKFLEATKRVEERLAVLERGRQALSTLEMQSKLHRATEMLRTHSARLNDFQRKTGALATAVQHLNERLAAIRQMMAALQAHRPGVLRRIVNSSAAQDWDREFQALNAEGGEITKRLQAAELELLASRKGEAEAGRLAALTANEVRGLEASLAVVSKQIEEAVKLSGIRFVDAAFFDRDHSDLHRDIPWIDPETLSLREEVFARAMDLHRAFVDSTAKQFRNNLDLLFRTFSGRSAWNDKTKALMPGLWATFFCLVPVVSTTFASVERMFGYLGPEALGWLMIDEAGQAVPQAAVGALMRARRAVVVGDPMQLQPVTSLPTELADKIAAEFQVNTERFVAPAASVQTLADASSEFGTTIPSKGIRVGVPLVVHRRCADPMFSLSNRIAYDGMMIRGRSDKHSLIRSILGASHWIDVRPERCLDKWSEAEGRAVIELLRKLDRAGLPKLDLYLISPFRIVAQKLRELLVEQKAIDRWTNAPRKWVKENVGTVHTVQGREADSVILVLGAAEPQRRGARNWAGEHVNHLNVAVTRAKENLYVIGNRFEWASAGEYAKLELNLP